MSSQHAMTIMTGAEFLLCAALTVVFWKKGLRRRFPSMSAYLLMRVASAPIFSLLLMGETGQLGSTPAFIRDCAQAYFFTFWAVYIASAVLFYFICLEIFRSALAWLPGLLKLGVMIFRWAALVSVIVTFSSASFVHRSLLVLPDIAMPLMRSVTLLELCLLAFLCLSMNALRLSVRDLAFGLSLGFGIMASNDLVTLSLISRFTSITAPLQFVYESVILFSLATWVVYCALPEPARKPVVVPVHSTIYRWNEIASALGHTGTQVAVQQPANGFFLTDVENVVEKVLKRNLKRRESES
ncbi:MAG TPA: hypothetical protein VGG56_06185 [Terracidiphilus sp.]|jgi:hypothetical protein